MMLDLSFFGHFSLFPLSFVRLLPWGERRGKFFFACVEFWVSFGKEKAEGEGNGVNKRGSYFFAMGESVANG